MCQGGKNSNLAENHCHDSLFYHNLSCKEISGLFNAKNYPNPYSGSDFRAIPVGSFFRFPSSFFLISKTYRILSTNQGAISLNRNRFNTQHYFLSSSLMYLKLKIMNKRPFTYFLNFLQPQTGISRKLAWGRKTVIR